MSERTKNIDPRTIFISLFSIIGMLIIILLVVFINPTSIGGYILSSYKFNKAVDDELEKLGVTAEGTLLEKMELRHTPKRIWLYKKRTVFIPSSEDIDRYLLNIGALVRRIGGRAYIEETKDAHQRSISVKIGTGQLVTYRLILKQDIAPSQEGSADDSRSGGRPKVAIIIDDVGWGEENIKPLLGISEPITFSVIPQLKYSQQIANWARDHNKEVIIHIPMEPRSPGKMSQRRREFLSSDMSDDELRRRVRDALDNIPYAMGANNHMGSKITEDEDKMRVILEEVKNRGFFFIDSRTTPKTKAYKVAEGLGMKAGSRDVFLDHEKEDIEYIKGQLRQVMSIAQQNSSAIAIGHPHPLTIEAIKETLPEFREGGIELVSASELVAFDRGEEE